MSVQINGACNMWIMIVMSGLLANTSLSEGNNVSPSITAIEFSSRDRCINAVKFTKQQSKIYNAFCVQK